MWFAKRSGVPVFIIGHVTKEGAIAGPRLLEHIVDTVLYFEGDKGHSYRILRAVKNRFGSTNEIGVFEMKESGLEEVTNPSQLFLGERPQRSTGSVVVSSVEGSRPILVELQALVTSTSYAMPKRMTNGVDLNRVSLLLAVMEKRLGMHLSGQDVYVNVVGGMHIDEPAIDLGIVAAVTSSLREVPVEPGLLVLGEVGLGGEVRGISQAELRIREAAKMGFKRCLLPERNLSKLEPVDGMELVGIHEVGEALDVVLA
jgi:DNA repair protein RadA/Sms